MSSAVHRAAVALVFLIVAPWAAAQQVPEPAIRSGSPEALPSFVMVVQAPADVRELLEKNLELRRYREVADLDDAEFARLIVLAEREARELLGTRGYFAPEVRITNDASGPKPVITIAVTPGEATRIEAVEIGFEGDIATSADPEVKEQRDSIRTDWELPAGRTFTQEAWDGAKRRALQDLTARRYLAGRITESVADIDASRHRGRLGLQLNSGPVFHLGQLQVTGVEKYDPVLVPRFSQLKPGQVYDRNELVEAQLRLAGSGYFDSAFIYVNPESDPAAAPVEVTVREAPLQRLILGLGLTTDSGVRASVEHTHNRLPVIGWRTVSKFNLTRRTPLIETESTSIPDEELWRWSLLARGERVESEGLLTNSQRLRAGRFRSLGHIDRNYYVQYDRATAKPLIGPALPPQDIGTGAALSVNYVWTGRYFDVDLSPTEGYGLTAELGGGFTLTGQRAPFVRPYAHGLYYRPLKEGRLQFRAAAGAVLTRIDAQVPATLLFRTGGDTTVRGYKFQEIGIELPNGRVGPGRYVASGSVEWQRPIRFRGRTLPFESMLFVDAGAVANRIGDLKPSVGVGAGVRWRSPVGPLEVALAYGVKSQKIRLHMNVGVTF